MPRERAPSPCSRVRGATYRNLCMQDTRAADGDFACKRPVVTAALRVVALAVQCFTLGACALAVNGTNESGGGLADATAWDAPGIDEGSDEDRGSSLQGMARSANRGSDSGNAVLSGSAGDGSVSLRGPSGSSAASDSGSSGSSDEDSSNGGGSSGGQGGDGSGNSPSSGHGPGNSNGSGKDGPDASSRTPR
jgi:hypothetical protein